MRDGRTVRVKATQRNFVRALETDLRAANRERQSLVEQLELSNEELKAANEEAMSTNEELQSSNEELLSSREELQSTNEELSTVNTELRETVDELSTTNDDLSNLIAATDIVSVFLDADFCVNRFTPAATRLLNLMPADIGRPIDHVAHNVIGLDVAREAEAVRRSGSALEKEVRGKDGRHYIVRILPYRREEGTALGVVVTFVDVTTIKTTEQALGRSHRYIEAVARLSQQALAGLPFDQLARTRTHMLAETLGVEYSELLQLDAVAKTLRARASVGWAPAITGECVPVSTPDSPESVALVTRNTALFTGLQEDARFSAGVRVRAGNLACGLVAVVGPHKNPWGVLTAFTAAARDFVPAEATFLETIAATLASAAGPTEADGHLASAEGVPDGAPV